MMDWHFIEPLDVLFLRGNKLFGDPGSYGESLVPPWPSAAAGAIRSMLLARDKNIDLCAFAQGKVKHPEVGDRDSPGSFRVLDFVLGRKMDGSVESLHAMPADLSVSKDDCDRLKIRKLSPCALAQGIESSSATQMFPVLAEVERSKPERGYWLSQQGFIRYLSGHTPSEDQLLDSSELWRMDERVGVGLDTSTASAAEGRLFTLQAVAPCTGVGFLAATEGASLPQREMLRLGGDGRAAQISAVEDYAAPMADLETLAADNACRIILSTPGLFEDGWRLPGMAADGSFELLGIKGKVTAAAVPRAEIVSGWDLAYKRPKPALRAAPSGSVYWLEDLQADADSLRKLAAHGLWPDSGYDTIRRMEGFNRFHFATY